MNHEHPRYWSRNRRILQPVRRLPCAERNETAQGHTAEPFKATRHPPRHHQTTEQMRLSGQIPPIRRTARARPLALSPFPPPSTSTPSNSLSPARSADQSKPRGHAVPNHGQQGGFTVTPQDTNCPRPGFITRRDNPPFSPCGEYHAGYGPPHRYNWSEITSSFGSNCGVVITQSRLCGEAAAT